MKCKQCGAQVTGGTTSCPLCGKPIRGGGISIKRILLIAAAVPTVLFVALFVAVAPRTPDVVHVQGTPAQAAKAPEPSGAGEPAAIPGVNPMPADVVWEKFSAGAADTYSGGNRFAVTGVVKRTTAVAGVVALAVPDPNSNIHATIWPSARQKARLATLTPGESATLECVLGGRMLGRVILKDCLIR